MTFAANSAFSRDIAHVLHPYTNLKKHQQNGPLIIARGEGIRVIDEQGKAYIDGLAGLWCASLGFSERRLVDAARRQLETLPYYHAFAHKSHEPSIDLAERILSILPVPMSKVFFNSSGSEANDSAIKMVWYYNNARGRHRKKKIISRLKAYHGVTVATASLTGLPNNHRDFDLPIANIRHADCPHHYRFAKPGESEEDFATRLAENLDDQILREDPETVAAFIAEPVMGAGGVIVPPRTYFEKIQKVLKKHDLLFIVDEVICGFGRTGNMFGTETFNLQPDIITMAKALSAGYQPISATIVNDELYQAFVAQSEKIGIFAHGFTYSAHPVACAVALETLNIYQERKNSRSCAPSRPSVSAAAARSRGPPAGRRNKRNWPDWRAGARSRQGQQSGVRARRRRWFACCGDGAGGGADPSRNGRQPGAMSAARHHRGRNRRNLRWR